MLSAVPPLPELRFAGIPAASRHRYAGDRFSYMEAGPEDAPAVLLLHGIGANAMHWRWQFAGLADRYRVIAWNAPGYMLTDALTKDWPETRDYADALADFLDALGIRHCHLVGNSFGSRVAHAFVVHHPGRAMSLATTGTSVGVKGLTEAQKAAILAARAGQIASGGFGFGTRVDALLGSRCPPAVKPIVQTTLRATNPAGFMQAVRQSLLGFHSPDHAASFALPVLLLQGSEDRVSPFESNGALFVRAVPHSKVEVLEGYGHLPEVEAPDTVNALLRRFFGQQ